ncbi:polysaccharide pyruvyl transferase family protein [Nafulsella turpanensis]|uniref:polysaccharide pyruvyl transferase family protein n=1 Tax=Nafulsella turpanensis TaxID=1265690 RepID=UPI00034898FB|nr:polysaccharide pyruvyl transferase family protein [Nafulsella turpanensis]
MSKKIAFITTVNHNVGDDFVREGLKWLFREYFQSDKLKFTSIHKHVPATSYYGLENLRNLVWSERVEKYLPVISRIDRVMQSDILVQSGAPVFWYHPGYSDCVSGNEWYFPLIHRRFLKKRGGVLANIAAGTCQKYYSDGSEFLESDHIKNFIKEFHELSQVTTLRDSLSGSVHTKLGLDAPVIPCSSIFAINEHKVEQKPGEYVVVNYMHGGAHYNFGQDIDFEGWFNHFQKFYFELKKKEKHVIFSCHNLKEKEDAQKIDPNGEFFFSSRFEDYLKFYAKAKYGVMNRVHAGFILASLGKPAVIIGNDSRARMAEQIHVEDYFVNDVDSEVLLKEAERLDSERGEWLHKIQVIKSNSYERYMEAFSKFER